MALRVKKSLGASLPSPVTILPAQRQRHLLPRPSRGVIPSTSSRLQRLGVPTASGTRRCAGLEQARGLATTQPVPRDHLNNGPLPLDGITVVSLEQGVAAPFCTRQLADLGARVIKIEQPGSVDLSSHDARARGMASHFVWTNRSKESLALDLGKPKSLGALRALLDRADVLVQNLAPGAAEKLGLTHDKLSEQNPGLIVCNISGYGPGGPYSGGRTCDLLLRGETGLLSVSGGSQAGISIADIASAMYAHQNILAALLRRGRTGRGAKIDVSMLESMAEWMSLPMYESYSHGAGTPHSSAVYPYGPFPTGSGDCIVMGVQSEREWRLFCQHVLGEAELCHDRRFASNVRRVENRDALRDVICSVFLKLSVDEVRALLDKAGVAHGRMGAARELWEHPQLRARGRWTEVDSPMGPVPALLPPGVASEEEVRMEAVPGVGDHNASILAEIGLTEEDLVEA